MLFHCLEYLFSQVCRLLVLTDMKTQKRLFDFYFLWYTVNGDHNTVSKNDAKLINFCYVLSAVNNDREKWRGLDLLSYVGNNCIAQQIYYLVLNLWAEVSDCAFWVLEKLFQHRIILGNQIYHS